MNERNTFLIAATASELTSSVLYYTFFPSSPLCTASSSLTAFAGEYISLIVVLWVVVLAAAWFSVGPKIFRVRQNLSTKLVILAVFGVIGVILDNAVSLYRLFSLPEALNVSFSFTPVLLGLLLRTVIYAAFYTIIVLISYLIWRSRKSTVTPPPRFGRE